MVSFGARSRAWFLLYAPRVTLRKAGPNPSNPDRRLVCWRCFPGRALLSGNWYAVECPRCGADAAEEMTPAEVVDCLDECERSAALHAERTRSLGALPRSRSRDIKPPKKLRTRRGLQ